MGNLIWAEIYIFLKRSSVKLFLLAVILSGFLGSLYVTKFIQHPLSVKQYFSFIYSFSYIVSLVLIVSLTVFMFHDEYENKTIKNSVFQGITRTRLLIAKYMALIIVEAGLLLIFITIVIVGGVQIGAEKEYLISFVGKTVILIPAWLVYTLLFESYLFMNKKVLIGLVLAYLTEQVLKIILIILYTVNESLYIFFELTPNFVLQNFGTHNTGIYIICSIFSISILLFISKTILENNEIA